MSTQVKPLCCFFTLVMLAYSVFAQAEAPVQTLSPTQKLLGTNNNWVSRIGPEVGIGQSTLEGDLGVESRGRMNYSVGAVLDIGRSRTVFETGLLYRQLGAAARYEGVDISYRLGYLSLPLGLKHAFADENPFYARVSLLPSFAVLKHVSFDENRSTETYRLSTKDFDVQALVGLGKRFSLSPDTSLQVGLNYLRGLISIDSGASIYNSAVLLTASLSMEK